MPVLEMVLASSIMLLRQRVLLSIPNQYDVLLSGGRGGGKSTGLVLLLAYRCPIATWWRGK